MQTTNIRGSAGTSVSGLTPKQDQIARQLLLRHGRIKVARERSGLHFYMPSPIALRTDGRRELFKLHLAVNIDKWEKGINFCGKCMKYDKNYSMDVLLTYPSLNQRGINDVPFDMTGSADEAEKYPELPGDTVSVVELAKSDPNHPCLVYLRSRQFFDFENMKSHVDASFCSRTNPNIEIKGYHRTGFLSEPEGRITLFMDEFGTRVGWQGRILDFVKDDIRYYWYQKEGAWVPVSRRVFGGGEEELPPYEGLFVPRYYLPKHSRPSAHMMGFDAARRFNENNRCRWLGIAEGPFDILRVGPPFCAVMGKHFNDARAELVSRAGFDKVFVVCDNDTKSNNKGAGETLWRDINKHLAVPYGIPVIKIPLPHGCEDLGASNADTAKSLINTYLKKHGIGSEALLK